MQYFQDYIYNLVELFNKISPFLILGFLISGILSILLTVEMISKYLGKKSFSSIFFASLFGVPLPLCSCGVIPVTAYLRNHGASKGSAASFLISTPQTGVDSIMVTYSLLGPLMALYRPIIAFISGLIGGFVINKYDSSSDAVEKNSCDEDCCIEYDSKSRLIKILHYGFVRLPLDIFKPLIVGLLLSALISIIIPDNSFISIGGGILGMFIMLFVSLPMYICATASIPLAFIFLEKGFSLGAILVFLMAGPATNITTITVTLKILGKKSTAIYLSTIVLISLISGYVLDLILIKDYFENQSTHLHEHHGILTYICSSLLFLIIVNSIRIKYFFNNENLATNSASSENQKNSFHIYIEGMTCSHCVDSVKKSLLNLKGVKKVQIFLNLGQVNIFGEDLSEDLIEEKILSLGYTIKEK